MSQWGEPAIPKVQPEGYLQSVPGTVDGDLGTAVGHLAQMSGKGANSTLAGLMAGNPAFNHACWACRAVYINLS